MSAKVLQFVIPIFASCIDLIQHLFNFQPTLQSRVIAGMARIIKVKERNHSYIDETAKPLKTVAPSSELKTRYQIDVYELSGQCYWIMSPHKKKSKTHVLYLHGGGYVSGITDYFWRTFAAVIDRCQCTFVVPDYPLLPDHTVDDAIHMLLALYQKLSMDVGAENIVIAGDSAGGGLSLALAIHARENGLTQPSRLLLLSPWLDVTMTNPEIEKFDPIDPILNVNGMIEAGLAWSGKHEVTSYLVSPIYGTLQNVAPITLLIGTHDLLLPDSRRFAERASQNGIEIDYREYEHMLHCWFGMGFMPEARQTLDFIAQKIVNA